MYARTIQSKQTQKSKPLPTGVSIIGAQIFYDKGSLDLAARKESIVIGISATIDKEDFASFPRITLGLPNSYNDKTAYIPSATKPLISSVIKSFFRQHKDVIDHPLIKTVDGYVIADLADWNGKSSSGRKLLSDREKIALFKHIINYLISYKSKLTVSVVMGSNTSPATEAYPEPRVWPIVTYLVVDKKMESLPLKPFLMQACKNNQFESDFLAAEPTKEVATAPAKKYADAW